MSVLKLPFIAGFCLGVGICLSPPAKAEPTIAVQSLAEATWPYLSREQRQLVDLVARDFYEVDLSAAQRQRIAGTASLPFDDLPEWRKSPFRGAALRQLGHEAPERTRNDI